MDKLVDIFTQMLKDDGFVIYCGAGISIPAPSCCPSWWTLTEEILEAFFNRAPDEWGVPKDIMIYDENKQPEAVFETFANVLEGKFYQIFDSLNVTEPNGNHKLIAKLAKSGLLKACITTNFDIFIERALREENVPFKLLVENADYDQFNSNSIKETFILCKIHGTIENPDTIVSVASAYKSNKGFSSPKAELIGHLLSQFPFLFLGYSGYDFNHLNYRRFWERNGPKLKAVYWNMRPNETNTVPFKEIFETSWNKFTFVEGDLPLDFLNSVNNLEEQINTSNVDVVPSEQSTNFFKEAKTKRIDFFKEWAFKLPLAHTLGLVMSQAFLFSSQFKDYMQSLKESQADKNTVTYSSSADMSNQLVELGTRFGQGEVTLEEYQKETNRINLLMSMQHIRKSWQNQILDYIEANKYPGVTDDMSTRSMWLSYIMQLSMNYDLVESVQHATEIALDYKKAMQVYDKNAQADMLIVGFKATLLHPKEELFKPYYDKLFALKEKFMNDELDYTQLSTEMSKIIQEQSKAKLGMTVPLEPLAKKLIENISQIESDEEFIEALEVLLLTMDMIGSWLMGDLMQQKSFQDHYYKVTVKFENDADFPVQELEAMDQQFRIIYKPIKNRIEKMNNPVAKILLDLIVVARWKDVIQSIGGAQEDFSKQWDEGRYPLKHTHPKAYEYHKERFSEWLNTGMTDLSHRVIQKLVRYVMGLAEAGRDIELIELLTKKSLSLTEGLVTEATPQEVPGVLAAYRDLEGKKEEALKYYTMALDAMKSAVPPMYQEAILYRAVSLMNEFPEQYTKKEILKTIGKLHPTFYGNQQYASTGSPATDLAVQMANKLAKEEGYANANEAIESLLGY